MELVKKLGALKSGVMSTLLAKREGKVLGNKRIAEMNKNIFESADAWAESKRT